MLFYSYPQIVVQEVPDEISLALSVSGCNLACKGCHSTETWNPTFGKPLTVDVLQTLIDTHKHISCVLFYGGEWSPQELISLFTVCKLNQLKTCLYTGLELEQVPKSFLPHLDYLKVGPYVEALGGLASPTTNQRFILKKDFPKH